MRQLIALALWLAVSAALADPRIVNGVEIKRGTKVELVFFTADNCPYCAQWIKASKDDFLQWAQKSKVAYREVRKSRISQPYEAAHFPPDARYAWEKMQASGKYNFLIPRWIVYADRQLVVDGSGLEDWSRVNRFLGDVTQARDSASR